MTVEVAMMGCPTQSTKIMTHEEHLQNMVCLASGFGIPAPSLMVSLACLDSAGNAWLPPLPLDLIQAQRDHFGAHTYERLAAKGTFHTLWNKE